MNPDCEDYKTRRRAKVEKARGKNPAICPKCGKPREQVEHLSILRCINPECPAQFKERLKYFAGRKQMDIENLGPAIINALIKNGLVQHFADLYTLNKDRLVLLEGIADKSAEELLKAIVASKERGMSRVLASLGIQHVGTYYAERLSSKFNNIEVLINISERDLRDKLDRKKLETEKNITKRIYEYFQKPEGKEALRDVGRKVDMRRWLRNLKIPHLHDNRCTQLAKRFESPFVLAKASEEEIAESIKEGSVIVRSVHNFFHSEVGRRIIECLKAVGVKMSDEGVAAPDGGGPLAGKTVVVTGTLEHFKRGEVEEAIKQAGGRATSSVLKKTIFLVSGSNPGSKKRNEARKYGIEIIDEVEFMKRLGLK